MTADAVGGVWQYAIELCGALGAHGVEVLLATMGPLPSAKQRAEVAALPNVRLEESAYRLEWMSDPWEDVVAAGQWLLELQQRFNADVIHLNGYVHAALDWGKPVLVVGHSCVYSWHEAVRRSAPAAAYERYFEEVQRGLRAATLVTAPTDAMLESLRRHYGLFQWADAIPNARQADRFRPRRKEPFILTAGRVWDEAKNIALLRHASETLTWPVYVAGEEEHPDFGTRAGLGGGIRPLGRLDESELAGWMGRASIYALPARYEPFGLSVLEAGLAGCALVLSDTPTLREVWGDSARYVASDDEVVLATTLQELIDDEAGRRAAAEAARARALTYAPDQMGRAYLDLYAALLHGGTATEEAPAKLTVQAA